MTALYPLLPWLAQATTKGSVAIIVMAAAHALVGRRLRARWWCALWLVALVRLAAPVTPAAAWSLLNLLPPHPAIELQLRAPAATMVFGAAGPSISVPWWIAAWQWLVAAWLIGFAVMFCRMIVSTIRMDSLVVRALAQGRAGSGAAAVVDAARVQLRIRREVAVIESPLVQGPALHGVFRPALLLPEGMCSAFDDDELRHVVLHELAHLRRHDVAVNWLLEAVRAVHWFNPLVWLAVARIQEERELACDELTLSCLDPRERLGYGRTILKLLDRFRSAQPVPALVGIVSRKRQMRRRLIRIADERRWPPALPILAVLGAIALMSLADAPEGVYPTLDPAALRTIERFQRPIDLDVTNATLSEVLDTIAARTGVAIARPAALAASARRARFTLRASHQPAAKVLGGALMPYGIVAIPGANGMTLTTGPPCLGRATSHR